jgi:TorA maturation chaperone TorD
MSRRLIDTEAKGNLYAFLSSLFLLEPSEDRAARLREVLKILKLPLAGPWSVDELKREYYDLFSVPNPRYVRPYESVYRDRMPIDFVGNPELGMPPRRKYIRGLLMGESTRDVLRYYRAAGVYPSAELPDHLGNELSFLGYLAGKESETSGEKAADFKRLSADFKKNHPLKWIGKVKKRVEKEDRTGYFRSALAITHALLQG